jgi:predicted nucleotidyltransferase
MFEADIAPVKSRLLAAGVKRLGIFGSYSCGRATPESDLDVLVTFRPDSKTYDNLFEVGEALEQAFRRRVDLVTEDGMSPFLGAQILSEVRYVDFRD